MHKIIIATFPFLDTPIHSFFLSFVRSLTHSLDDSLTHPFIHSFILLNCLSVPFLKKNYGRNDPRAKRPTGETTHLIRAKRPTPKTRAKRPRAKRPGETTHGRNDPDSIPPRIYVSINFIECPLVHTWRICCGQELIQMAVSIASGDTYPHCPYIDIKVPGFLVDI